MRARGSPPAAAAWGCAAAAAMPGGARVRAHAAGIYGPPDAVIGRRGQFMGEFALLSTRSLYCVRGCVACLSSRRAVPAKDDRYARLSFPFGWSCLNS